MTDNRADPAIASNDFMTNGKCHDQCSGYAFAVVQNKDCWCSNVAPGGAQSGSSCSKACPGYPFENCGDQDQGLFGYVALGPAPSSTQGGSSPSPSPSQAKNTSPIQQPVSPLLCFIQRRLLLMSLFFPHPFPSVIHVTGRHPSPSSQAHLLTIIL